MDCFDHVFVKSVLKAKIGLEAGMSGIGGLGQQRQRYGQEGHTWYPARRCSASLHCLSNLPFFNSAAWEGLSQGSSYPVHLCQQEGDKHPVGGAGRRTTSSHSPSDGEEDKTAPTHPITPGQSQGFQRSPHSHDGLALAPPRPHAAHCPNSQRQLSLHSISAVSLMSLSVIELLLQGLCTCMASESQTEALQASPTVSVLQVLTQEATC